MGSKITFGQELKRYRNGKGISQFDLTVMMDWSSTSPLIQIEKDRRLPKLETIEKLSKCLELDYIQTHYLFGLAGLQPKTGFPRKNQVIKTLEHVSLHLDHIPYPSFINDYRYGFWLFNPASSVLAGGEYGILRQLLSRKISVFDVYFNSRLGFCAGINNIGLVRNDQIFRFKATNMFRQHEDFFMAYPECMGYLGSHDYEAFKESWGKIGHDVLVDVKSIQIPDFYNRMEKGDIQLQLHGRSAYFHIAVQPILHLGDLFQVVSYIPVNSDDLYGNKEYVDEICRESISRNIHSLKLWDLTDIDSLLE